MNYLATGVMLIIEPKLNSKHVNIFPKTSYFFQAARAREYAQLLCCSGVFERHSFSLFVAFCLLRKEIGIFTASQGDMLCTQVFHNPSLCLCPESGSVMSLCSSE